MTMFNAGDIVDVIGTSKGKGFAGVMKRHNFHGGQRTHGQSDRIAAPAPSAPAPPPAACSRALRMAGRMGHERVTVQNLRVVSIDPERNLLTGQRRGPRPHRTAC